MPTFRAAVRDALSRSLVGSPDHAVACGLFVRLLGGVYLCAFASLWPQLLGLVGSRGMLPAAPFLRAVATRVGGSRFALLPTLHWLGSSDGALQLCCGVGIGAALLVVAGRLVWPSLLILWACYLSLVSVGRDFMSFQWDTLLLECGFLALVLVPVRPLWQTPRAFAPAGRWLLLWLLWRLMFSAGWAKLRSGDPTWRDLSALHYHFETQPLPTWLGYYAHRLPDLLKRLMVIGMFVIELGAPMLIFSKRALPYAFFPLAGLMALIAATGNYGFFNLLAAVLCVPLLPDMWLERVLPRVLLLRLRSPVAEAEVSAGSPGKPSPAGWTVLRGLTAALLLLLSLEQAWSLVARRSALPAPIRQLVQWTAPFHLSSRYGLFAVMTTTRPEIIIEGSVDGHSWTPYEFKYKPGALQRAPRWAAPHQPRLDWQMWFAAMGPPTDSPWLQGLCIRLLQGSPDVLWLLERDPFSGHPPRYLRANLYQYRYTTAAERAQSGAYWHRDEPGEPYIRPVSLGE